MQTKAPHQMNAEEILNEVAIAERENGCADRTRLNALNDCFMLLTGKTVAQGLDEREASEAHEDVKPSTFEAGKTYSMRSACDQDCEWKLTVAKRTAKTVTFTDGKRCRISVDTIDGGEFCRPLGSYSMAPILRAERVA